MIFIAFISQVAMVAFFWIGNRMTPAPFWNFQQPWSDIFNLVPRITLASWTAFLISENFDAIVYAWFKKITKGKHLWMRNSLSSLPSLFLDSVIFISIAFWGVAPVLPLIVGQIVIKWIIGLIDIPFMYANRKIMSIQNGK